MLTINTCTRTTKEIMANNGFGHLKRCAKCILPETFPKIEFNKDKVCNYCMDYQPIEVLGEERLVERLEENRNNGKKYDCLVPISGGRDSSFVLHQIVEKYKMRTLALTVDSGAITSEGYRNIYRIIESLKVDHIWIRDEHQIKTAKKNATLRFHAWLKKPSINTIVPVLNAGDKTMNRQIYQCAAKQKIPLVIGGNNIGNSSFEQEHFKTGFLGVFPDEQGIYTLHDRVKLSLLLAWEYFKNPYNFHWSVFKEYLDGLSVYFFESLWKPKEVTPLRFFDYIYWDEKQVMSIIREKLKWKGASDTTATWRVDDAAYPLIDYIYNKLLGFTEFDEYYSKLIREGQLSRDEGLRRCLLDNAPRMLSLNRTFRELRVKKRLVDMVLDKYRGKLHRKLQSSSSSFANFSMTLEISDNS